MIFALLEKLFEHTKEIEILTFLVQVEINGSCVNAEKIELLEVDEDIESEQNEKQAIVESLQYFYGEEYMLNLQELEEAVGKKNLIINQIKSDFSYNQALCTRLSNL